jgi:hypothetical protein
MWIGTGRIDLRHKTIVIASTGPEEGGRVSAAQDRIRPLDLASRARLDHYHCGSRAETCLHYWFRKKGCLDISVRSAPRGKWLVRIRRSTWLDAGAGQPSLPLLSIENESMIISNQHCPPPPPSSNWLTRSACCQGHDHLGGLLADIDTHRQAAFLPAKTPECGISHA